MRRGNKLKPNAIIDYNRGKGLIDVSDQLGSYHSCFRKGVKWYRKVALDIICNTELVNAFSIYKKVTNNNIYIKQFRKEIAETIVKIKEDNSQQISTSHSLVRDKKKSKMSWLLHELLP